MLNHLFTSVLSETVMTAEFFLCTAASLLLGALIAVVSM